jgi:hypothetical protein
MPSSLQSFTLHSFLHKNHRQMPSSMSLLDLLLTTTRTVGILQGGTGPVHWDTQAANCPPLMQLSDSCVVSLLLPDCSLSVEIRSSGVLFRMGCLCDICPTVCIRRQNNTMLNCVGQKANSFQMAISCQMRTSKLL